MEREFYIECGKNVINENSYVGEVASVMFNSLRPHVDLA